jgi:hypothetical protein
MAMPTKQKVTRMKPKMIVTSGAFLVWVYMGMAIACPKGFAASTQKGSYVVTVVANIRSNVTSDSGRPSAVLVQLCLDGKGQITVGSVTTTIGHIGPIGPTSDPVFKTCIVASNGSEVTNVRTGLNPPFILLPSTWELVLDERCGQQGSFLDLSDMGDSWNQASLVERAASFSLAIFNDTYVVKESWLNRVVGIVSFKGTGAVAGTCCFFGRHGQ